jgi:DNA-binding response OmpR family regulator
MMLPPPLPPFRLARHILLDFEAYEHEIKGIRIPMCPRERQLLLALVEKYKRSPRGLVSTPYLIEWLFPNRQDYDDPKHSIRQIASNIRRKWGEPPRSSSFLICIRDAGYRLAPQPGYGFEDHGLRERNLIEPGSN